MTVRFAAGLIAVPLAAFAVLLIRSGLRGWRNVGDIPLSRRYGALVDEQTRAGWDRGGLIIGLGIAFMAIMMTGFAVTNLQHVSKPGALVLAAAATAMIVCVALYLSILILNRPKFLVPPQHRSEPGAVFAHRRRHGGRHAGHAGRKAGPGER